MPAIKKQQNEALMANQTWTIRYTGPPWAVDTARDVLETHGLQVERPDPDTRTGLISVLHEVVIPIGVWGSCELMKLALRDLLTRAKEWGARVEVDPPLDESKKPDGTDVT